MATSKATHAAKRYRCGKCGAPTRWDPQQGALACGFCDGTTAVPVPDEEVPELFIAEALDRLQHAPQRQARRIRCGSCAAVVELPAGRIAGTCPFCGDHAVAELSGEDDHIAPMALLPFSIPKEQAVEAYRTWLADLWFRAGNLKDHARLEEMDGVYVPFWLWQTRTRTWWRADVGRTVRHHDRTSVSWSWASDTRERNHDDILVYASTGLDETSCREIEPFDLENAIPFDANFLAGFAAESYAKDPLQAWPEAEARIHENERKDALVRVPGDTYRNFKLDVQVQEPRFKHLLLPVWISAYRYQGKSYRFLVNGRTGEVHGTAPWSWPTIVFAVALLLALLGGIPAFLWHMASEPPSGPAMFKMDHNGRLEPNRGMQPIRRR